MEKSELLRIMGAYWENMKRDMKTNYIICPDFNCDGFLKKDFQCISSGTYSPSCPKKEDGYRILHCHRGHANKLPLDICEAIRVDCRNKDCSSASFYLMSGSYLKIPLELIDEFLEKEFVKINIK